MKTLIVDDNKISLEFLNEICMDSPYVYVAGTFTDPEAAWKFAKDNYIELALLDVRMPKLNGIELGKRICEERKITINKLATLSALPPSSIKNILYGKSRNPKLLTIKMICDGLDITLSDFFSTPEFDSLDQEVI